MDFGKLKKSEFQTRKTTKGNRAEAKKDTLAFRSNDDIKRENINRYVTKLADRLKINGESVADLSGVIKRLLGFKVTVYELKHGRISDSISNILKGYIDLLSSDDGNKERYLRELNQNIGYYFKESMESKKRITKNLTEVKSRLKKDGKEEHLKLVNLLDELSMTIYDSIVGFELETIEDLEILNQKVMSMKNIVKVNRYHISDLSYYMDYLSRRDSSDYAYRYLIDNYYVNETKIPKIEEGIKTTMRIIKKM